MKNLRKEPLPSRPVSSLRIARRGFMAGAEGMTAMAGFRLRPAPARSPSSAGKATTWPSRATTC